MKRSLLVLALILPVACSSQGKPPPPKPGLADRMALATQRALDLNLDGALVTMDALRAFSARQVEFTTWAALHAAWTAVPILAEQMDPQAKVLGSLSHDADWPKPPEVVADEILVEGFFRGLTNYLEEAGV